MTYVLFFSIAGMLGFLSSKSSGKIKPFFALASGLTLAALAGLRSVSVGTDVGVYLVPLYNSARSYTLKAFLTEQAGSTVEPLFASLVWVTANTFSGLNWVLFFVQLFTVLPVTVVLVRLAPGHVGSGMLIYSLVSFGASLNVMRQSVAGSLLLLALLSLLDGKRIKYLFWVVTAAGFHLTGLLGLVLLPLVFLFGVTHTSDREVVRTKRIERSLLSIFAVLALVLTFLLAPFLLNLLSGLKDSYAEQVVRSEGGSFSVMALVITAIACLAIRFVATKELDVFQVKALAPLAAVVGLSGVVAQYSVVSSELGRLGTLFLVSLAVYYPLVLEGIPSGTTRRPWVYLVMSGTTIFYFYWVYVSGGSGEIYPYSSDIIPSLTND